MHSGARSPIVINIIFDYVTNLWSGTGSFCRWTALGTDRWLPDGLCRDRNKIFCVRWRVIVFVNSD